VFNRVQVSTVSVWNGAAQQLGNILAYGLGDDLKF